MVNDYADPEFDELYQKIKKLASSDNNDGSNKMTLLYGSDIRQLAFVSTRKCLFLENTSYIPRVLWSSCKIFAYLPTILGSSTRDKFSDEGLILDAITNLVKMYPVIITTYSKLSFCQTMKFIKYEGDSKNPIDLRFLMSFLGELRATSSSLCPSNRAEIRSTLSLAQCYPQKNSSFCDELNTDATYLLNWASIEAARYCIVHRFSPGGVSLNNFLSFLKQEISSPVTPYNKISRKLFLDFIKNLDKFVTDRVVTSSNDNLTFRLGDNVESFYESSAHLFRTWFSYRRIAIANLAIRLNEPAECWRNADLKSWSDLNAKLGLSDDNRAPLHETLTSLGSKNWRKNLIMLAQSARSLGDADLLHGLLSLTGPNGMLCSHQTHQIIVSILNNLMGHFEANYETFKDSKDLDQDCLVEFLDACVEFNCIETHQESIDKLQSEALRQYYRLQVDMTRDCPANLGGDSCLKQVDEWLSTWVDIRQYQSPSESRVIADSTVNLVIPAYLREVTKVDPSMIGVSPILDSVQLKVSSSIMGQLLLPPNGVNKKLEIYTFIIDMLRGSNSLIPSTIHETKDLLWNKMLCRALYDFNMMDLMRHQSALSDQIQLRAAKYHLKQGNIRLSTSLALDLYHNSTKEDITLLASGIIAEAQTKEPKKFTWLKEQIHASMDPNLTRPLRLKLRSKSTRRLLAMSEADLEDLKERAISEQHLEGCSFSNRNEILESPDLKGCVKLIATLSKISAQRIDLAVSSGDKKTLIDLFSFDIKILHHLMMAQSKIKQITLDCAIRLLNSISVHHAWLSSDNLRQFTDQSFMSITLNAWLPLKNNIMSVIDGNQELSDDWRQALIKLTEYMVKSQPQMFVYAIISNRLELQENLTKCRSSREEGEADIIERRLDFWRHLSELMKVIDKKVDEDHGECWPDILCQTEIFVKEMKRISFLRGDQLKKLIRMLQYHLLMPWDRIFGCLDESSKISMDPIQLERYIIRLRKKCSEYTDFIKSITDRDRDDFGTLTSYDRWFNLTFDDKLTSLRELMTKIKIIDVHSDIDQLKASLLSIKSFCQYCKQEIALYSQKNRGTLYMGLISQLLTKFDLKQVLMPDTCTKLNLNRGPRVKIHKINQTINLIVSKTFPMRLRLIGSDGIARSFLLKSQDDLRLDQLMMDIFSNVNVMLACNKATNNDLRLRDYSVTLLSTNSGLIRWIEAPSLQSLYTNWFPSRNGRKMIEAIYKKSCKTLCDNGQCHEKCQPPESVKTIDLFYQLLWTKIYQSKSPLARSKPTRYSISSLRSNFDAEVFQNVLAELTDLVPNELISNHLWFSSNNSHSYWMKTNQFSRSCATISMVGYILGIGDRHPDNILLDHKTGEVIHIDYSVCFEFGQNLPIPEQVPFRLTQNMTRAFGFAGLEGSFFLACCRVLDTLKDSRTTLLHLLDPIYLNHIVGQLKHWTLESSDPSNSKFKQQPAPESIPDDLTHDKNAASSEAAKILDNFQDQVSHKLPQNPNVSSFDATKKEIIVNPLSQPPSESSAKNIYAHKGLQSTEIHLIDTILAPRVSKNSVDHIRDRVSQKLSGNDYKLNESLVIDEHFGIDRPKPSEMSSNDSVMKTEDHVAALIKAATSKRNMAAMFEGWHPWI